MLNDLEKHVVRNYTIVGNFFMSLASYFVINSEIHLKFWLFMLIYFSVMSISSTIQAKFYYKACALANKPLTKNAITLIFCTVVFPLTIGATFIVGNLTGFHMGYMLFASMSLFFGALVTQAAIDTVVNVFRKEMAEIEKNKINFVVKTKKV